MSTSSNPIQSEDFAEAAVSLATPDVGEAVASSDPIPTDRYLSTADVAASKAADEGTVAPVPAVVDPAAPPAAKTDGTAPVAAVAAPKAVPGAPPEDRWDTILDNARKKARAEVEGEYAWAKDLNRDEVEATRKWIALGNQNALMALDQLVQGMIRTNPDQKAQIERYFKSILNEAGPAVAAAAASAPIAAVTADDPMPLPDIPTDSSNGVPVVYSDKAMLLRDQWLTRQITKQVRADLDKDLAPIRTERAAAKETAEKARIATEANEYSTRAVGAISSLPGYDEFKGEIAAAYAAIPLEDGRTEGEKVRDAYLGVVSSKMSEKARLDAVASVTRRAEAGTVNPASQSATVPFDYKSASWEQALRHEFNSAALGR